MSSMICPVCRTEYAGWAQRCSVCGIALVMAGERIDVLSLPEEQQVVYELNEWTLDQRALLGEMLAEEDIPHAWDDTDVVVAEFDEGRVDDLCARVESIDEDGADGPNGRAVGEWPDDELDAEDELDAVDDGAVDDAVEDDAVEDDADAGDDAGDDTDTGDDAGDADAEGDEAAGELTYELDEWTADDRGRLELELRVAGIEFSWEDDTTLVVAAADEARVDAVVDGIAPPPAEVPEATFEVLSELFIASDKLRGSAADEDGLRRLSGVIDTADSSGPPYGVTDEQWDRIVDAADALADALADADDDEVVQERANELRELVRPFV